MAGLAAAIIFCILTVVLLIGTSRRRCCGEQKAFIVIPFDGDTVKLEASVRAYYYEEMLERLEFRRTIIVACRSGIEDELEKLSEKYPSVKIVDERNISKFLFNSINRTEKDRSDVRTSNY